MSDVLNTILNDAIRLWAADQPDFSVINGYWRGTADLVEFAGRVASTTGQSSDPPSNDLLLPNCVVPMEYARWAIANDDARSQAFLIEQAEIQRRHDRDVVQLRLARGLTAMATAAVRYMQEDFEQCAKDVAFAATMLDRYWRISR